MTYVRGTAVPWYREEDYPRILDVMTDGHRYSKSFKDWLERSERKVKALEAKGHTIERIYIDPDEFVRWCLINGLETDTNARGRFSAEVLARKYKNQS